ncbi:hypothetical protein [Glycomyces xiaoerkulensis]|uniref:hypothetical protein n=1 Tax=Glycomyces xiaoerkulensis TaxID=2038139 RepID=UPI000C25D106|nr:hypothetical protein [Glycomyces xiaoerkulensis]
MKDNAHTDHQGHTWQTMLTELPYAAEAIRSRIPILDTRRRTEALTDGDRVGFIVRDEIDYHIEIDTAELDQAAPGWRDALTDPANTEAEGHWELIGAVQEYMTECNESATAQWIALIPIAEAPDD